MGNRHIQLLIIYGYWAATVVLMWGIYTLLGRPFAFNDTFVGAGLGILSIMVAELRADRK